MTVGAGDGSRARRHEHRRLDRLFLYVGYLLPEPYTQGGAAVGGPGGGPGPVLGWQCGVPACVARRRLLVLRLGLSTALCRTQMYGNVCRKCTELSGWVAFAGQPSLLCSTHLQGVWCLAYSSPGPVALEPGGEAHALPHH